MKGHTEMTDLETITAEMDALDALLAEMNALTVEITLADLNLAQRKAADRLIAIREKHEIKKLLITRFDTSRAVTLYVETGMIGDEGTLAALFARTTTHARIGSRGGVSYI